MSIVVVREIEEDGVSRWAPANRFGEIKDARQWVAKTAPPGVYHILAFRDEAIEVKEAPPAPVRNQVTWGTRHGERGPRAKGEAPEAASE